MGQVTIYLDNCLEAKMKQATRSSNLSVSKWMAEIIKEKTAEKWPRDIVELAGSWGDDFPTIEELRQVPGHKNPRNDI